VSTPTVTEPVGTSRQHTSEPRWPTERPPIDASATTLLIVAGPDDGARQTADAWRSEAAAADIAAVLIAPAPPTIGAALDAATVGTRLMVAGDECVLALATSEAERAGWSRSEVRTQRTVLGGERPVRCVHCRTITTTDAEIDDTFECGECGVPLLVFAHYSRRIGAYLGFRADAEELPA
jgi:dimethylamine monooxygenase subunit C